MKKTIVPSFVVVATALCLIPTASPAWGAEEVAVSGPEERTLPSGAEAVLWPRPGSGTVLVSVAVPAGSQDEPEGMGGLSHYLEHLLFDGFDELDERGVTEAFEHLSAYMNAFTREQATVYFVLVPKADAVAAAELMVGMLTRSTIGPEVYEKEKKVILEELAKDHASADGLKEERIRSVLWGGTPLEHPVGGSEASVEATPRDSVVSYWQERYVPSAFRILVTGDLDITGLEAVLSPFAVLGPSEVPESRQDQLDWTGWGEWAAASVPETPAGDGMSGMPGMGGGHGMPDGAQAPSGGTMSIVVAVPDTLAASGTAVELLARWLDDLSGPLASLVGPGMARDLSVARLPRQPRDLLEVRIETEIGAAPDELLAGVLGALEGAAVGPSDTTVASIQRAWAGERALSDQRLHYAAVFFGEALAASRGPLPDAVGPPKLDGAEVRAAATALLTEPRTRVRAAWVGDGGPTEREPLPESKSPTWASPAAILGDGPLGSEVTTLDNGMVVGVLPEVGSDVFGIHLLVADRTLREPENLPGVADFVHRLLAAGTVLGGNAEVANRFERAGFEVKGADSPMIPFDNRYHVPDFSYVRIEGPADGLETALSMLGEMIRAPAWDADGWRAALADHKAARAADNRGSESAQRLFFATLLGPEHPLASAVSGRPGAPAASEDEVRAFWGTWPDGYFGPSRLILTVASPVPSEQTLELVEDYFSGGSSAKPERGPYPAPQPAAVAPDVNLVEAPQITLLWGRSAEVESAHRVPLMVAMDALSDRMTAVIREREGLAYRLGAGARPYPGGGWVLWAIVGTRPSNRERVASLLGELAAELAAEPLTDSDLDRLRARRKRSWMLRGLSAASRAYRVGRALFEGDESPLALQGDGLESVTPEQVRAAAERYLVPGEMLLVVTR
ncbi:MAG: insulinase family protein [Holophagae bacterium]